VAESKRQRDFFEEKFEKFRQKKKDKKKQKSKKWKRHSSKRDFLDRDEESIY